MYDMKAAGFGVTWDGLGREELNRKKAEWVAKMANLASTLESIKSSINSYANILQQKEQEEEARRQREAQERAAADAAARAAAMAKPPPPKAPVRKP
ncbi:hypothetical protein [Paenibacillus herberti]|uniref:Uncharacterized protein n=1 Tax=Paenibacillus herberti TaxID=1619309 RepID=A0A229P0K1_9BACL|nr:hypothetical protein [Paenibacillus herberti]OXM15541.1 hypothetical protein CGZ75_02040 [Paenibacillus herberti]